MRGKTMMIRFAYAVLHHKKIVLGCFIAALALAALLMPLVRIDYNLSDYLPADAPSTVALHEMDAHFDGNVPNARVMVPDYTLVEALALKPKMAAVDGVTAVLWLDDVIDLRSPLEMADPEVVASWYKDGNALFSVAIASGQSARAVAAIRTLIGDNGAITGPAASTAAVDDTMKDVSKILLYVIPLVLIILLLTTSSWFEPLLFILAIGVAILLNEGSNLIFGHISFVTRATSAILQLAVSMDYAVFLLHDFARHRHAGGDVREAMQKAMVRSSSAIAASALTTVFGFLALTLMRFRIGPDMGLVLAKGVLLSYFSVTVLLPVLTVYTTKIIDKTHHRSLLPNFGKFSKLVVRVCLPLAVIVLVLIPTSFLAQRSNTFIYGSSGMNSENSRIARDTARIEQAFGSQVEMVLLVPEGQPATEVQLEAQLLEIPKVTSLVSYNSLVGRLVPADFLDSATLANFRSGGYSRIILYAATNDEGAEAFAAVQAVRVAAAASYGTSYYLLGQSVVNLDLKDTIIGDNLRVQLAAILAIGLIVLLTFRSASVPLILLLTIEGATWINLGLPYFTGEKFNYIGYQIISSVQLGATVDYGILFTQHYLANRQLSGKLEAVRQTITETAASILAPASILTLAGVMLGLLSNNGLISQLGSILGRGAAISAAMVLLFLPALLIVLDRFIAKTTWPQILRRRKL
jgi:uncharacterized protein